MKASIRVVPITLAATLALLAGCASQPNSSPTGGAAPVAVKSVPKLRIVQACGGCDVPEDVPGLIEEGYAKAAAEAGTKVSPTETATLTIKELSYRSAGARIAVGAFAGKDEIKADVAYKDKKFSVEDYYRNAWQGISSLARKIGAMAHEQLQ